MPLPFIPEILGWQSKVRSRQGWMFVPQGWELLSLVHVGWEHQWLCYTVSPVSPRI